jgi:hypothetical protein
MFLNMPKYLDSLKFFFLNNFRIFSHMQEKRKYLFYYYLFIIIVLGFV